MANYWDGIAENVQSSAKSLNLMKVVTASLFVVVALALSVASMGVSPS